MNEQSILKILELHFQNPNCMPLLAVILTVGCNSQTDIELKTVILKMVPDLWRQLFLAGDEDELSAILGKPLFHFIGDSDICENTGLLQELFLKGINALQVTSENDITSYSRLATLVLRSLELGLHYLDSGFLFSHLKGTGVQTAEHWKDLRLWDAVSHKSKWSLYCCLLKLFQNKQLFTLENPPLKAHIFGLSDAALHWEFMLAYMYHEEPPQLVDWAAKKHNWTSPSSVWCAMQSVQDAQVPSLYVEGLCSILCPKTDPGFLLEVLKYGEKETLEFVHPSATVLECFSRGVAIRLELISLLISATLGNQKKIPFENEAACTASFAKDEKVYYKGIEVVEYVTIIRVHVDDSVTDPYVTIQFQDGREKQTLPAKLSRTAEALEDIVMPEKEAACEILKDMFQLQQTTWTAALENTNVPTLFQETNLALMKCLVLPCLEIIGSKEVRGQWSALANTMKERICAFDTVSDLNELRLATRILSSSFGACLSFFIARLNCESTLTSLEDLIHQTSTSAQASAIAVDLIHLIIESKLFDYQIKPLLERVLKSAASVRDMECSASVQVGAVMVAALRPAEFRQFLSKDFKAFVLQWSISKLLLMLKKTSSFQDFQILHTSKELLTLLAPLQELPSMWEAVRQNKEELIQTMLSVAVDSSIRVCIYEILQGEVRNRKVDFRDSAAQEETETPLMQILEAKFSSMEITEELEKAEILRDFQITSRILPHQVRVYLEQQHFEEQNTAMDHPLEEKIDETEYFSEFEVGRKCDIPSDEHIYLLCCSLVMDYINSIDESDDIAKGAISTYVSYLNFIPHLSELSFSQFTPKQLARINPLLLAKMRFGDSEMDNNTCMMYMKTFFSDAINISSIISKMVEP